MPALQVIALDTTTPRLRAPGSGDTYSAPRAVAIAPESLTGSAATTSLDITQTWNTTGTPTALKLNVTDTASNAASLLMDLQVGGVSVASVAKTGGFSTRSSLVLLQSTSGTDRWAIMNSPGFVQRNSAYIGWATGASDAGGAPDLTLFRDAANTLALRNSTNAQAFNVYNTFTDASNYERGFIRYSSNQLEIGHEAAGTGSGNRLIVIRRPNAGTVLDVVGSSTTAMRVGTSVTGFALAIGVGPTGVSPDIFLARSAAGIGAIAANAGGTTGATLEFLEQTAPAAPAADRVRIYAEDNGSGKTRLMALFATGAAQQIAIEP